MSLEEILAPSAARPRPAAAVSDLAERLGWLDGAALEDRTRWFREGDNVTALHARSDGRPTRLVGLTWIDGYQGVLSLPGTGIAEPAQLAGRRLGLPRRDDGQPIDVQRAEASRGFHAATALACLFSDEFEYADVAVERARGDEEPYAAEAAALLHGEVDAIYVAGRAGRALADRIGAVEVVDLGAHLDPAVRVNATTPAALTVDERTLAREPDRVVTLLAALLRAGAWAETHEDAVRAAYGRRGIEQQLHIDLSTHKLAALGAQKDFLLTHGFLTADVDTAAWADPGPLAAARERVANESRR
ncbi:substrate-binding domain-containing protein [Conexibacter woesei]|uniref:Desulfurizing enzyme n=1 Tax=Conexibacter woesei (strain DSM 14684 / CCUG 47730 / CIP 108061 / JCM 11494 / NBRC 100937 / ID131577) TaxID=469383 RepID=D3FCK0_CONWI|nr:hypothetical protein [Conexibacter woesei]ADB49473.1 desulfurizing enzyme [Conexibacter woesei DSM 14684]